MTETLTSEMVEALASIGLVLDEDHDGDWQLSEATAPTYFNFTAGGEAERLLVFLLCTNHLGVQGALPQCKIEELFPQEQAETYTSTEAEDGMLWAMYGTLIQLAWKIGNGTRELYEHVSPKSRYHELAYYTYDRRTTTDPKTGESYFTNEDAYDPTWRHNGNSWRFKLEEFGKFVSFILHDERIYAQHHPEYQNFIGKPTTHS